MDVQEIYAAVEGLSSFGNTRLCIASRISTAPSDCETFNFPTLSIEAARGAFRRINKGGNWSDLVDDIPYQLDFHPPPLPCSPRLVITAGGMLAGWAENGEHNERVCCRRSPAGASSQRSNFCSSLGCFGSWVLTPERSLASLPSSHNVPTRATSTGRFRPYPTERMQSTSSASFRRRIEATGSPRCWAPLRDHLSPEDPKSSSFLCDTQERYFARMPVMVDSNKTKLRRNATDRVG